MRMKEKGRERETEGWWGVESSEREADRERQIEIYRQIGRQT